LIDLNDRKLPPHPFVVQMYGVSIDGPQPIIVMEYCSGGEEILFSFFISYYNFNFISITKKNKMKKKKKKK
jgi:serine/threonine protein kinase